MKMINVFLGISTIGIVLISGCLDGTGNQHHEEATYNETIYNYSTPGFEINKSQALIVWNKIKGSDEAKFVTSENSYSAVVFVHPYSAGPTDLFSAEWIAVLSSIDRTTREIKIAVFRLDYQTFELKTFAYNFSYPMRKELTLEQVIAVMEEELKKEPHGDKFVDGKKVGLLGDNYIYSYPASDFGGTIVVNKYTGRVIFYATTVWSGKGRLIFPGDNEIFGKTPIPYIENRVESYNPPAYRGTLTNVTLYWIGSGTTKGTEISLEYKIELLHANGSFKPDPRWIELIPEKKRLIFQRTATDWDINLLKSNFTVNIGKEALDGDYYITVTAKYRGMAVGSNVLSFKIGRGGNHQLKEKSEYIENLVFHMPTWNIGYTKYQPPPLSEKEKAEAEAIAVNDPYLSGKKYNITEIVSEFYDINNFLGFFPVITADIGEPDKSGETVRYIVDLEEKKVLRSTVVPRIILPPEYLRGQEFDEATGNFTEQWDALNFPGFWLDPETNASTETLVIDQSLLNNSYRIIDRHNLRYTTNITPLKYQVYAQVNWTPEGTDGTYQAMGWLGEKHVYLQGNRLAKIIFEQNATEEKEMTIGESWELGEGYKIIANSISAKDSGGRQAWISLFKDSNKLVDTVMVQQYPNKFFSYRMNLSDDTPNFIIYYSRVDSLPRTDAAYFKYTWLRSQNFTEIKEGDTFGIMEVTSIGNGKIELRNKEPIDLAPGNVVNLMGNISIQVGSSNTSLSFHPFRVRKP